VRWDLLSDSVMSRTQNAKASHSMYSLTRAAASNSAAAQVQSFPPPLLEGWICARPAGPPLLLHVPTDSILARTADHARSKWAHRASLLGELRRKWCYPPMPERSIQRESESAGFDRLSSKPGQRWSMCLRSQSGRARSALMTARTQRAKERQWISRWQASERSRQGPERLLSHRPVHRGVLERARIQALFARFLRQLRSLLARHRQPLRTLGHSA
jgi:hypothetical protein